MFHCIYYIQITLDTDLLQMYCVDCDLELLNNIQYDSIYDAYMSVSHIYGISARCG